MPCTIRKITSDARKLAKPVEGKDIAHVGTISANGDAEIGRFIADAMKKVGNEGVITVEEAKSLETELDVVEGMQFDRGYISPYFVTNAEKMRVEMEDPYILIYEKKLSSLKDLLPASDLCAKAGVVDLELMLLGRLIDHVQLVVADLHVRDPHDGADVARVGLAPDKLRNGAAVPIHCNVPPGRVASSSPAGFRLAGLDVSEERCEVKGVAAFPAAALRGWTELKVDAEQARRLAQATHQTVLTTQADNVTRRNAETEREIRLAWAKLSVVRC